MPLVQASLVTAYAALRPRDGFSHPHQEHMKYTYSTLEIYVSSAREIHMTLLLKIVHCQLFSKQLP